MSDRKWVAIAFVLFFICCYNDIAGQEDHLKSAAINRTLSGRGEIIIKFRLPPGLSVNEISRHISIDDFRNDTITAYANAAGFEWFSEQSVPFEITEPPSLSPPLKKVSDTGLDAYPSYPGYIEMMNGFADDHSDICKLIDFGSTVDGRRLLALKITDFPGEKENEPVVFYTASMHGDEPLGYVILLNLIGYLLQEYPGNDYVKELIDHSEIWINPLANPDGAYFVSDSSIYGAKRFNRNNVDLNRDFPAIPADFTDSMQRQPETRNMMNFMKLIRPTLAANFHGGAEVVNYPWDTWESNHADDSWYRKISRAYADTVHAHSPEGYMTYLNDGITRGISWYQVTGSRQDYVNYYLYGREVTIELSDNKTPPGEQIVDYWNYNRNSLLHYLEAAHTGFHGTVTDSMTGDPLQARVRIIGHDRDNSFVFSDNNGHYFRPINEGTYQVVFSATGYRYKIVQVSVTADQPAELDVLLSNEFDLNIFPNPFRNFFKLNFPYSGYMLYVSFTDMSGRKVKVIEYPVTRSGENEISVKSLAPGFYIINMSYNNLKWQFRAIKLDD